jgi:hypothetical protein
MGLGVNMSDYRNDSTIRKKGTTDINVFTGMFRRTEFPESRVPLKRANYFR